MKLTMLGTGNAAVVDCYNTCFALSENDQHFLVDAGGGNYILKALQRAHIRLEDIHDIFITHEHADHLLGVIWLIRMIGQRMNQNKYEGMLRIYCHSGLVQSILTIAELTVQKKVTCLIGGSIQMIPLEHGEEQEILGCRTVFFDIQSTKAKQFGFSMTLGCGRKLSCCGDEPYQQCEYEFVKDSDLLMHEAFCLYREALEFKPYEKHHSTVKEACELAQRLQIPNLLLYHTEEKNLKRRKELYTGEGKQYYEGTIHVPDDLEILELDTIERKENYHVER